MSSIAHTLEGGLQLSRAQAIQAESAGTEAMPEMNPILLKPCGDMRSEVIVMGKSRGEMPGMEYFARKKEYIPTIMEAFHRLEEAYDTIVIEGAGSPAEINLKKDDIVNMGLAKLVDAPVLLVADINPGGVFAQIYGTLALLEEEERARVKGIIINKFRGDIRILEPGIKQIEGLCAVPVLGVLPYMKIDIEEEDSLKDARNVKTERSAADRTYREEQYDVLADAMEKDLDMETIINILR